MNSLSVVIITRNEEHNIVDCIRSAKLVSDDIIIVDSGSNDKTRMMAEEAGARVYSVSWTGYGNTRNLGAEKAKNHWILALDADERISIELAETVAALNLAKTNQVFKFRRKNYIGGREIRFGTPGYDTVSRIYNRNVCKWNQALVHERLIPNGSKTVSIPGHVIHLGFEGYNDYRGKSEFYARMSAEKYFREGRKATWIKRFGSPVFNSVKSYIFRFGFLDGKLGITVARTIARYTWLKYSYLHQHLHSEEVKEPVAYASKNKIETVSNV